ncbi:fasciclin domain-containing protein [Allokutzneria sp. A3M-2-11 16]|uniref:fasciclin domain-containing protein n=1 Tax=Allokutzneria sp. A3M-2-11 16 TaxID=2962043 RepID=UPI0020B6437C|nr:fasciclin domain-containing protein [Allokutzneria sp. A3M-2-11 16]MCP3800599.1 fasciclin domain-containing protein [Allokutzneria sp. A3M-2-11 16]
MQFKRTAVLAAAAVSALGLTACSDGTDTPAAQPPAPAPMTTTATMTSGEFGSACSSVPTDGPGSFAGMAKDPVATAASNNPALSTLVTAVKKAGLVDTLNTAKDITVFAPADPAFAKIPKADLDKVLADNATLTKVLTYHVVPKRLTTADLASGNFETLQKGMVKTSGAGTSFKVNDASVICGNVQTANATVYIIDTVLMPS